MFWLLPCFLSKQVLSSWLLSHSVVDSHLKSLQSGSANKMTCQKMMYFNSASKKLCWPLPHWGRGWESWESLAFCNSFTWHHSFQREILGVMERVWDWKLGNLSFIVPFLFLSSFIAQIKLFVKLDYRNRIVITKFSFYHEWPFKNLKEGPPWWPGG